MIDSIEGRMQLLNRLWVIDGVTLKRCGWFPPFEEIRPWLVHPPIDCLGRDHSPLVFISHRWETRKMPDPRNYQYSLVITNVEEDHFYWYDYTCMPQRMETDEDKRYFEYILESLNEIVTISEVIILRSFGDDYFARGWCFHEWFTAQFIGGFGRTFLHTRDEPTDVFEILHAKRQADRLIGGKYSFLDELGFSVESDRETVRRLSKAAAVRCQRKIAQTCLEIIASAIGESSYEFPDGLALSPDDIHRRFSRLVRFIKVWTLELQVVEPVTDRMVMFFHAGHWEALIELSQSIAVDLLRLEYGTDLREEEATPADKELRKVYEYCQRKMPEAGFAVTAFLCFFLMGYDVYKRDNRVSDDAEARSAEECGLICQQYLNADRYEEAETYAQSQLRKAQLDFDDEQTEKALSKLGRIYRNLGDYKSAQKYYQRSLNLSEQMCDDRAVAIALDQIGSLHRLMGNVEKAIDLYKQSLNIHQRLHNDEDIGVEYGNLGVAHKQIGKTDEAYYFLT